MSGDRDLESKSQHIKLDTRAGLTINVTWRINISKLAPLWWGACLLLTGQGMGHIEHKRITDNVSDTLRQSPSLVESLGKWDFMTSNKTNRGTQPHGKGATIKNHLFCCLLLSLFYEKPRLSPSCLTLIHFVQRSLDHSVQIILYPKIFVVVKSSVSAGVWSLTQVMPREQSREPGKLASDRWSHDAQRRRAELGAAAGRASWCLWARGGSRQLPVSVYHLWADITRTSLKRTQDNRQRETEAFCKHCEYAKM